MHGVEVLVMQLSGIVILFPWIRKYSFIKFRADEESRKKEELVNEIKRLQKTLVTYHNDKNHLIDVLKQSRRYQEFLFKFAPEVRY